MSRRPELFGGGVIFLHSLRKSDVKNELYVLTDAQLVLRIQRAEHGDRFLQADFTGLIPPRKPDSFRLARPLAQHLALSLIAKPLLDPEVVKPSVIVHISVTSSVSGHGNSLILGRA